MKYNKITLTFPKEFESSFRQKYLSDSLVNLRRILVLLIILYGCFGFLDFVLFPAFLKLFLKIRFLVVIPLITAVLLLSYTKIFSKIWQILLIILFFIGGAGISIMTVFVPDNMYYAGLMLVFAAGYFLVKLRFVNATIAGWTILILYNVVTILYAHPNERNLIHNNFFFVSINIMGMIAAYNLEYGIRRNFFLKRNLDLERETVLGLNKNLENTVTERTRELIIAKEKAEESDRLKTAFLQNMSHEIRTPMNAIMGFSELIAQNICNKEKLERYVSIINKRSSDLLVIIDDILDIAKIESGQLKLNYDDVNITQLLHDLEFMFNQEKSNNEKHDLDVFLKIPDRKNDVCIVTDKSRLMQILINLLNNAVKFTNYGSIEFGYSFSAEGNLVFFVADTGIGIPKEKQEAVFERFIQLNNFSDGINPGNGLGLSITKGLVKLLGGEIWVHSEVNKGSTFYFTLKSNELKKVSALTNDFESNRVTQLTKDKTVLIVEDDKINRDLILEMLSDVGLNLITATKGLEAVNICSNTPVDLILMDIGLPDITGYEATRRIVLQKPGVKIIAQTAFASELDKAKALESGCIDFLSKPLKLNTLIETIKKYL